MTSGRIARVWFAACAIAFVLPLHSPTALAQEKVALELVLALDTSTSVDAAEYELQRSGIAHALRDGRVISAVESLGAGGMALAIVQWSGPGKQVLAVPWRQVLNGRQMRVLAREIEAMPRKLSGFTDIAGAIDFAVHSLQSNRFDGERKVIDVSGDGTADGRNPSGARDAAVSQGITVNGLIIHSVEYDLGTLARIDLRAHYTRFVIGGAGAFLMEVEDFDGFAEGIRNKLVREITGPLFAAAGAKPAL